TGAITCTLLKSLSAVGAEEGSQVRAAGAAQRLVYSKTHPPRTGGARRQSPHVPLVVFDAAQSQKLDVFFLETLALMMLLLVKDVPFYRLKLCGTNRYTAITRLPVKTSLADRLVGPERRP